MPRRPRDASTPHTATTTTRQPRSRPTPRWLTTKTDLDTIARNRVLLVLSVLSGEKPVTIAIADSGISRGFYYQLETKALNAMLLALAPGGDGDSSTDAAGLHHRIKQLEQQLAMAETAQRRAERMLLMQRKLGMGPVKTHRGRPTGSKTSSTPGGPRSWRSSTTTKPPRLTRAKKTTTTPSLSTSTDSASTPTPDGENEDR